MTVSRLKEARERLYDTAIELALCRDEVSRTDGSTAWRAHKLAVKAHEQAARDFAAAEGDEFWERWYRCVLGSSDYESGREDGHDRLVVALRAGGLAQEGGGR